MLPSSQYIHKVCSLAVSTFTIYAPFQLVHSQFMLPSSQYIHKVCSLAVSTFTIYAPFQLVHSQFMLPSSQYINKVCSLLASTFTMYAPLQAVHSQCMLPSSWFLESELIPGETRSVYVLQAVSHTHNKKTVTCQAANKVGNSSQSHTLDVNC